MWPMCDLRQVADALKFPESAKAPSRATLERFGNTSLSSTFYILANIESTTGVKRGEKVCSSAIQLCLRMCHCL